ncbi:MAG: peptidylprolyl isomerase [Planctomycetota bacterium]
MADTMNTTGPSGFQSLDPRIRKWIVVSSVAAVTFFVGWAVVSNVREREVSKVSENWLAFSKFESPGSMGMSAAPPPVDTVSTDLKPWVGLISANKPLLSYEILHTNLKEARPLFQAFDTSHSDSSAARGLLPGVLGAKTITTSLDSFDRWEEQNPSLLDNPQPVGSERARIVTDVGTIEIGFYPDLAPKHVENFRELIRNGFYQKTKFHRVSTSGLFVVQGGDPNSIDQPKEAWGKGSKGDGVPFEKNRLAHVRGAVAMAQPGNVVGEKKSSGCQFYFVTKDSASLNGRYTVFGKVINGMDVVDKIAASELEKNSELPVAPAIVTKTEIF